MPHREWNLVGLPGIEPGTYGLGNRRSVQLSYNPENISYILPSTAPAVKAFFALLTWGAVFRIMSCMIAFIHGTVAEKEPGRVVVEAAGVGYELFISLNTFDRLPREGEETKLLAWHSVREDDEALYGFAAKSEKEMFTKLVQVSGVGPKMALAILSGTSIGELTLAISSGNAKRIASVKGVGKKTAEKICVELKDKVDAIEALAASAARRGGAGDARASMLRDALLALTALGFSEETANKMVSEAVSGGVEFPDAQAVVRAALARK